MGRPVCRHDARCRFHPRRQVRRRHRWPAARATSGALRLQAASGDRGASLRSAAWAALGWAECRNALFGTWRASWMLRASPGGPGCCRMVSTFFTVTRFRCLRCRKGLLIINGLCIAARLMRSPRMQGCCSASTFPPTSGKRRCGAGRTAQPDHLLIEQSAKWEVSDVDETFVIDRSCVCFRGSRGRRQCRPGPADRPRNGLSAGGRRRCGWATSPRI